MTRISKTPDREVTAGAFGMFISICEARTVTDGVTRWIEYNRSAVTREELTAIFAAVGTK